jgi:serine/threonine protein kinase
LRENRNYGSVSLTADQHGDVMPPRPLEPGDPPRLGRFELLARLGEGGQGVVYLGRGTGPGEERVAVKVLRSSVDTLVLERLGRELDAIHQVQPFVTARVIEASAEGDRRFVVSEFIDGPSLQERIDVKGPMAIGDLHRLAVGTATALTAIHGAGVVHRDFKPANVLLGPDGPRVVDFGIARLIDAATITSGVIGTPSYLAPEQLAGARPTSAVDIFAWAVTMVYAATGRTAFGEDTVPAVMRRILYEEPDVSGLPPTLAPLVRQCLDKDPNRRPSARDVLLRLVDPSLQQPQATHADPHPGTRVVQVQDDRPTGSGPMDTMSPRTGSRTSPRTGPNTGPRTGPVSQPGITGSPDGSPWPGGPYAPAPYTPAPYTPYTPAPARSRRGPVLIASAVVVAAVIVAGVLLLTRSSPPSHLTSTGNTPTTGSTSPSNSNTSSSPPPATPAAAGKIPSAFAGTWSGTSTMVSNSGGGLSLQSPITFTLAAGGTTANENNQGCINTLTLIKQTTTVLTFNEPQTSACEGGTVTFTRHGTDLAYRWLDVAGLAQASATLHKG